MSKVGETSLDQSQISSAGVVTSASQAAIVLGEGAPADFLSTVTPVNLINGTQALCKWTAPDDGSYHVVMVFYMATVPSNMTGGEVSLTYTQAGGPQSQVILNAGQAASPTFGGLLNTVLIDPGSTIEVVQDTALTAGAATVWAALLVLA